MVAIAKAISELSEEGITGVMYWYRGKQCSCCYGLKDVHFNIEMNTAPNMGCHTKDTARGIGMDKYRINYEGKHGEAIANALRRHLRGSGSRLDWSGDTMKCMFINSR